MHSFLRIVLIFILALRPLNSSSQSIMLDSVSTLAPELSESSGLLYLEAKLLTHNDSGGEAALYEVDTISGAITRKVVLENASNVDWEDIALDDKYIYVGDFGNNRGDRQNLRIYKISISDYQGIDTVIAETISFAYAEQTDFTPSQFQTNFDAEALISYGDSLYIFSKNWGNMKTYIYPLSKVPGAYQVSRKDSLDTQGLITGATYNRVSEELFLCGYTFSEAFVVRIDQLTETNFPLGNLEKSSLQIQGSFQIEGITETGGTKYYLSAEGISNSPATLYSFELEPALGRHSMLQPEIKVFPVPASDKIRIEAPFSVSIVVYSLDGKRLMETKEKELDVSAFSKGMYFFEISIPSQQQVDIRKIRID